MTVPVGFETNLLTGIATLLEAHSPLGATFNTSGAYTVLQTGIFIGNIQQNPDRIIALDAYGVSDDPSLSDSVTGVQIRCRWGGSDKRPVFDLDAAIFDYLHAKTGLSLSTGVWLVQILRSSGPASLGQDGNGRWSVVSNYYASAWRPSANRT